MYRQGRESPLPEGRGPGLGRTGDRDLVVKSPAAYPEETERAVLRPESTQNSSAGQEAKRIKVSIKNKLGLHLRPASQLVKLANQFPTCEISIAKDGQQVNAKSIMGVVMLAAELGCELEIEATGPAADEALASLERLIESGFGEEM